MQNTEDNYLLLDSHRTKKRSNFHIIKIGVIMIISVMIVVVTVILIATHLSNEYKNIVSANNEVNNLNASIYLPYGFDFVEKDATTGPITVNREEDDGTKLNLYDFINKEDLSFYYDEDKFNNLAEITKNNSSEYFCEYGTGSPPEAYEGYEINCPYHYTITIDKVFYGRHAGDKKHCDKYYEGVPVEDEYLTVEEECGNEPIENVKEICEGKASCSLRPGGSHFTDSCESKFKYLHVNYHCTKDKVKKKKKFILYIIKWLKINIHKYSL